MSFHLTQIIDYLKQTNRYYLQYQLPNIDRHLQIFIHTSGGSNASLQLLGNIFASFREKLCGRIQTDEKEWFPQLLSLGEKEQNRRNTWLKFLVDIDELIEAMMDDKIFFRHLRLRDAEVAASQDVDVLVDQHHVFQTNACPCVDIIRP